MKKSLFSLLKTSLLVLFAWPMRIVSAADPAAVPDFGGNVVLRGNLENSRQQFEHTNKGNVVFLGGSITEMEGYRPMVCSLLEERFPKTEFTFTNAGIGSTCSTTGAFRLRRDVLDHGPVDLLFVEFAVNDDQDGHLSREECIRGMEGVVRHALLANPKMDVVMTFFVNEGMLKTLQSGGTPLTVEAHEAVADHYGISTINLAKEAAEEITAGKLTWAQYGGVHPAPLGNRICANMIGDLFRRAWGQPAVGAAAEARALPPPLDPLSYFNGRFIDPKDASQGAGWALGMPDWSSLPGGKRSRFTSIPMFCASEPGAEAAVDFSGTCIGAYLVAGPDAGIAEASIDGGPPREVDCYHEFSAQLHYPCTVMFADDLASGKHTLRLRVSPKTGEGGHALRIMEFVAN